MQILQKYVRDRTKWILNQTQPSLEITKYVFQKYVLQTCIIYNLRWQSN